MTRRQLLRLAVAAPAGAFLGRYAALAAPYQGKVKITAGAPPRTRLEVISARYVGACAAP